MEFLGLEFHVDQQKSEICTGMQAFTFWLQASLPVPQILVAMVA